MFDASKMMLFFANNGFHPRFSFNSSQLATNQKAHDLAKYMDNILEQLHANLLMSQKGHQKCY